MWRFPSILRTLEEKHVIICLVLIYVTTIKKKFHRNKSRITETITLFYFIVLLCHHHLLLQTKQLENKNTDDLLCFIILNLNT